MASTLRVIVFLLAFAVSDIPGASKSGKPGVADLGHNAIATLWRDSSDTPSLNLIYGSGGEDHQPRPPFTFVEEDPEGSNPKFDIRDQDGVKWKVKLGAEVRPEVAASRLVWAAGYFTNDDYFLKDLPVQGLPSHLHRGQSQIGPDGAFHNVRLKRSIKDQKKIGSWQWGSNPFLDTREFNGLRVMMALLNNWDLKDINNTRYENKRLDDSGAIEQIYVVSDLGASFGTTGIKVPVDGAKGNLEAYKRSKFITNRAPDYIDFGTPGTPALIETFKLPMFLHRIDLRWIGRHVPRADAKWIGQVLGQLSEDQIRDAFRAAGYADSEVNEFAGVVQSRIAELNAL